MEFFFFDVLNLVLVKSHRQKMTRKMTLKSSKNNNFPLVLPLGATNLLMLLPRKSSSSRLLKDSISEKQIIF